MTGDEIREFVTNSMKRYVMNQNVMSDEVIDEIVERWKEDVQENRDDAVTDYREDGIDYLGR